MWTFGLRTAKFTDSPGASVSPVEAAEPAWGKARLRDSLRHPYPESKALLTEPKWKIGDSREMAGYADTAHFARTFKKLEGMSANEYRNSLRG